MANSAVVGLLRALLVADTAEFEKGMARASKSAQSWSKDLASISRQAQAVGSALTKTVTLPLVGLATASAKAAIDFESSFAGVRKTIDGTEEDFAKLSQQFRDLAKTIPVDVNELNRLGEAAGALGIPKESVKDFVEVMAKLGVTTNLTSDQAADAIARIQNIFGAAGKDTEKLASTLVALGNAGASTEKEIVEMAQRIAGAGHSIGLSQAQVLSFASTLASVGINAEAGGSAISRIFLKMNDAVMDGGDALKEWARVAGVSVSKFKDVFQKDAAQATLLFVEGLQRLKQAGENTNGTMEGLIGKNIILKDTLNRLSGSGKLLADQLAIGNKAWDENNALSKEAAERFKTTASQMQLLWNRVRDVGITLGNALLPAIRSLVELLGNLIPIIDAGAKWFAALPEPIQTAGIGLVGLVAAAGPVLFIFGQLAGSLKSIIDLFGKKGLATRVLTGQVGVLGTAMTILSRTVSVLGAAFTGWSIGRWIGETTGLTDKVEWLSGRIMGLTDAQIAAGMAARKQAEAHRLQAEATQDTVNVSDQLSKAMSAADKAATQTQAAMDGLNASTKTKTKVDKDAEKAAKELKKAIEEQEAALRSLGLVTEKDVNTELEKLQSLFAMAQANGIPAQNFYIAITKQLEDLAAKAKASGIAAQDLNDILADVRRATFFQTMAKPFDPSSFGDGTKLVPSLSYKVTPFNPMALFGKGVSIAGPSIAEQTAKTFGDVFSASLGPTLVAAFTGGGSPVKAVGSMAGMELGKAFVGNAGAAISKTLGKTLGGVVNSLIPGLGAMLGPLVGKVAGWIGGMFKGGEGAKVNDIRDEFLASAGGADELYKKLQQIGRLDLWGPLMNGPAKTGAIKDAIKNIDSAMSSADKTAAKYGLSLESLVPASEKVRTKAAALVKDFNELRQSGFSVEQAAKGMAGALNEVIGLAMDSGELLPNALTPLIHQLVDAGMLSEDLAAKLLGVANPVPWQEMEAAAERYGVSVDKLGKQFEQAKFDEATAQIVKDWDLLSKNGEDLGDVMNNMSDEVSSLVQKALDLGLTLPKSMQPMIKAMFDAGLLVDKNGDKLEQLGDIKFADDLASQFDTLIGKLDAFITKLADLSGLDFSGWRAPGVEPTSYQSDSGNPDFNPPGFADGTHGRYVNFGKGTLAMLHGREKITPAGVGDGNMTLVFQQDGRDVARWLVPFIPDEVRRLRLA